MVQQGQPEDELEGQELEVAAAELGATAEPAAGGQQSSETESELQLQELGF